MNFGDCERVGFIEYQPALNAIEVGDRLFVFVLADLLLFNFLDLRLNGAALEVCRFQKPARE